MPQTSSIPANPAIAAMQASAAGGNPASPVQVHQGATGMIPAHPMQQAQQIRQAAPAMAAPQHDETTDFFARVAMGEEEPADLGPDLGPSSHGQGSQLSPQDDDLLGGGSGLPQAAPPVQLEQNLQQQQAQQVPVQQPMQQVQQQPVAQQASAPPSPEAVQQAAIDYLRGNTYRLSDAQAKEALTAPELALPDLAARVHVNVTNDLARTMFQALPQIVAQQFRQHAAVQEAKLEFFRRYPRLNRTEWMETIAQSLTMARQMNPNATRDQLMADGAALAAYRIRSSNRPAPAQGRPQPFVPASPGSGGPAVPTNPQQTGNVWAEMAGDPDLFSPF